MSTHRFNIASLRPSEVHSRAFNAIEAAEAVMAGLSNGLSKDSPLKLSTETLDNSGQIINEISYELGHSIIALN
ncbi:hypothetical protein [Paludibacterium denitrificans]|uniref:Uncharacterized protein n=1 Tax=Paludibacterium denitrificans TaxID=2675226 RepID=A0A844GEQ6_9NEIS|nr:hypothetical protein [Paludibacterium denitrificans]MTD34242.1 hypothetical protein [Paludibacterium denitrificans]